jgi:membrane protein implicated in regulation of membrane protease activity
MSGSIAAVLWIVLAAALFVIESVTTQFVGIWFAAGAVIAVIPALLGAPFWLQLLVFLLTSILFLFWIRPIVKTRISVKKQPTNADMVVGKTGLVLEEIDNVRGTGRVSAMGLTWTARTEEEQRVPADTQVLVSRIEGAKLIVSPLREG